MIGRSWRMLHPPMVQVFRRRFRHTVGFSLAGLLRQPASLTFLDVADAPSKLPDRMSSQYIYTMYKLSRTHPPDKTVLKDINLSFFPGAKIGVLGLNGSGKSTLLRIMAGQDTEYRGEAQL